MLSSHNTLFLSTLNSLLVLQENETNKSNVSEYQMRMSEKQSSNPIPVVDTIIQHESKVLFAKRKNDPFKGYLGLPGGFVNSGETIEEATRREVKEETSLDIELTDILGVFSDPQRDPRGHIMSTVFIP